MSIHQHRLELDFKWVIDTSKGFRWARWSRAVGGDHVPSEFEQAFQVWISISTFVSYLHLCHCEPRPRSLVNPLLTCYQWAARSFIIPLWGSGCTWELGSWLVCVGTCYLSKRTTDDKWMAASDLYRYSSLPAWRGICSNWCGYQLCLTTTRCFSKLPFLPFQVRPCFLLNICA